MLERLPVQEDWTFADKTISDTAYITHGIYTYPAKFIPQLAARLIHEHTDKGDIIIDPFMGSGTTIVEALVNQRIGIGVDINEIASLITKVKTTFIPADILSYSYEQLMEKLQIYTSQEVDLLSGLKKLEKIDVNQFNLPERVDYWFKPHIKQRLIIILHHILQVSDSDARDLFLVIFAQILKSCSIWLQKSVKPTRDLNKQEIDPFEKFAWQAKRTLKRYQAFDSLLNQKVKDNIDDYRHVENGSAHHLPCADGKASLIVTSPPYVTSYEYADLHQLPSLWLGFLNELPEFRKKFIGSAYRQRDKIDIQSQLGEDIISQLGKNKKSREVENYFADMLESFIEMKRVLKKNGKAAIVIGNTTFSGVDILNAEVFEQQMTNIGFQTFDIIHRKIPSKMLPSTRDAKNGRFVKATNQNQLIAYPSEYILIMKKS
ncbi:MAG: site-specific DNA-methyltransferase [Alphaproteobacteria bacterium]|nr:site-specific DNA-methyltransferase [Alphaproteobacteria bacterium]